MSKSFVCCLAIIAASMALVWAAVAVAGKPTKGGRLQPQRRARQAGPDFKGAPPGGEHARGVAVQKMRSRIYQGTRIEPMPDANGAALALQQQIAVLLAQLDPMPKQRLEYYAWLHEMPVWISGWQGSIKAISPFADGWLVRVISNPLLSSDL